LVYNFLGSTPMRCTFGPSPILERISKIAGIESLETRIHQHLIDQSRRGFPLKKDNLFMLVQSLLLAEKLPNPFPGGFPGKTWFYGLLNRWPDLCQKAAEHHSLARAAVTEVAIRGWFFILWRYFLELLLMEVLSDRRRVINCDEAPFRVCETTGIYNIYSFVMCVLIYNCT